MKNMFSLFKFKLEVTTRNLKNWRLIWKIYNRIDIILSSEPNLELN